MGRDDFQGQGGVGGLVVLLTIIVALGLLQVRQRRHLPAQDVAEAGGRTDIQTLTTIYRHATPDKILEVGEVGSSGPRVVKG